MAANNAPPDPLLTTLSFTWTIKSFSSQRNVLTSPEFQFGGSQFTLTLVPTADDFGHISVNLFAPIRPNIVKLYIISVDGRECRADHNGEDFAKFVHNYALHIREFISRAELLDPFNGYLSDDQLTIVIEIQVLEAAAEVPPTFQAQQEPPPEPIVVPEAPASSPIVQAQEPQQQVELRRPDIESDEVFLLVGGGRQLLTKKTLLAAYSPIFAAMFDSDPSLSRVDVTDQSVYVWEAILRILDTGIVPMLDFLKAELQLKAADRYQFEALKTCCEDWLLGQIDESSVARLLPIAETANADRLMEACLEFISRQYSLLDQINNRNHPKWSPFQPYFTRHLQSLTLFIRGINDDAAIIPQSAVHPFEEHHSKRLLKYIRNDNSSRSRQFLDNTWNTLHLFPGQLWDITQSFSGVKCLQIAIVTAHQYIRDAAYGGAAYLLDQWRTQLVTFKMYCGTTSSDDDDPSSYSTQHEKLFTAINALPSLKTLHLDLVQGISHDLPIISQLEELVLGTGRGEMNIGALLEVHGEGARSLKKIQLKDVTPDDFTELGSRLRSAIIAFDSSDTSGPYSINLNQLASFTAKFSSLTRLTLCPVDLIYRQLLHHLSSLSQLVYLGLETNSNLKAFPTDNQPNLPLPQVPSIKALNLQRVTFTSHKVFLDPQSLPISHAFPNVQVIEFGLYVYRVASCTDCEVVNYFDSKVQAKSCLQVLFGQLKRDCTKLRPILHDCEAFLGAAEEILA